MSDNLLAARIAALFNEAFRLDPDAVKTLVGTRVPCNAALEKHQSIQVAKQYGDATATLGIVGLLNGLFLGDDCRLVGLYEAGKLVGFGPFAFFDEPEKTVV